MIIYFTDGMLLHDRNGLPLDNRVCETVDAGFGVYDCEEKIKSLLFKEFAEHQNVMVYTNYLGALNTRYHWNNQYDVPQVFLEEINSLTWIPIQLTTSRQLRKTHNFPKLYLAHEFNCDNADIVQW